MKDQEKEATMEAPREVELPEIEEVESVEEFAITRFDTKEKLNDALIMVDRALEFMEKAKEICMKRSYRHEWMDYDGKPYLKANGCRRFAGPFGIRDKDKKVWTVDADGKRKEASDRNAFEGDIRYIIVEGYLVMPRFGIEAHFVGGSTMDDGFRDKSNVLFYTEKAVENWFGRSVRKTLGLDDLPWSEFERITNFKRSELESFAHRKTEKGDTQKADEVWNMLLELNHGNKSAAEDQLQELTKFKDYKGARNISRLSAKQLSIVGGKVKELHAKAFPEKDVPASANSQEEKPADVHGDDKFLQSITAIRGSVKDEDYDNLLGYYNVTDPAAIPAAMRNKFLVDLNKLKGGK